MIKNALYFLVICVIFAAGFFSGRHISSGSLGDRLYVEHMKFAGPYLAPGVFDSLVKGNIRKDIRALHSAIDNMELVRVGKTLDTGTYTITIVSKNQDATIWLYGDGSVRSVSSY